VGLPSHLDTTGFDPLGLREGDPTLAGANPRVNRLRAPGLGRRFSGRSPRRPPRTRAVARLGEERWGETKMMLGFRGSGRCRDFCFRESRAQPSISDERLTHVGLDKAQAGGENADPSLRCSNLRAVGWVTGCFPLLGRTEIVHRAIFLA
jgi:hypothetical protein